MREGVEQVFKYVSPSIIRIERRVNLVESFFGHSEWTVARPSILHTLIATFHPGDHLLMLHKHVFLFPNGDIRVIR